MTELQTAPTVEVTYESRIVEITTEEDNRSVEIELPPEVIIEVASTGLQGLPGTPGADGVPGPAGPPGAPGSGSFEQPYNFASPDTTWTINHNLNTFALNVITSDQTGEEIEGDVQYLDTNTIEVYWYYPTAGSARLFR